MPRTLSSTGQQMLETLPPYYAEAVDALGVIDTLANEVDRVDGEIVHLIGDDSRGGELFPTKSEGFLDEWERVLSLPVDPSKSTSQRRLVIRSVLESLKNSDSANAWKTTFDRLIGIGWSYAINYDEYTLTMYLPYGPEMSAPTNLSVSASSGTDSFLAAGTYFYAVTSANAYGESEYEGGISVTAAAGETVDLTWDAPAVGAPERYYVYRGASIDTMFRLDTPPITGTNFTDGNAATFPLLFQRAAYQTTDKLAPTVSTTQSDAATTIMRIARQITPAHINISLGYTEGFILNVSKVGDVL